MDDADMESLGNPGSWPEQLFFLPGDYLLSRLISRAPDLAAWLEVGTRDYGGGLSAVLSILLWAALVVSIRATRDYLRLALRAALTMLSTIRLAIQTRIYVAKTASRRLARRISSRFARDDTAIVTGVSLDALDAAILAIEARLGPGMSLTAPDLAAELGVRPSQAQQSLDKLKKYALVSESFGSMDGFDGYQITQSGRFVVSAHGLSPAK